MPKQIIIVDEFEIDNLLGVREERISATVAADGAMVVLVVVVSPGTGENEFGEEELTLMSAAALTDGSITVTVIEKSGKMTETES
jgi:hypothetical protein